MQIRMSNELPNKAEGSRSPRAAAAAAAWLAFIAEWLPGPPVAVLPPVAELLSAAALAPPPALLLLLLLRRRPAPAEQSPLAVASPEGGSMALPQLRHSFELTIYSPAFITKRNNNNVQRYIHHRLRHHVHYVSVTAPTSLGLKQLETAWNSLKQL